MKNGVEEISMEAIKKAIRKLKKRKASGQDALQNEARKYVPGR